MRGESVGTQRERTRDEGMAGRREGGREGERDCARGKRGGGKEGRDRRDREIEGGREEQKVLRGELGLHLHVHIHVHV